ncbi:MAG: hypothetical protein ACOCRX_02595 [Candidatus Woesearchaeota archaeon]
MEKEKKYKLIISAISLVILLGFGGFYLVSSNVIKINGVENQETTNPNNLFEGSITELEEDYLTLDVTKPSEINGDSVKVDINENTKYKELKLEVHSIEDVRREGSENIDFDQIKTGDEALVAVNKNILDNIKEDSDFRAKIVTKITSKEVE